MVTVEEAALLVGMVNAPYAYNPRLHAPVAMQKRNMVINDMVRNGFVIAAEAERFKANPIKLNYRKLDETKGLAPYFRDVLRDQMKRWCKEHKKGDGEFYNLYKEKYINTNSLNF